MRLDRWRRWVMIGCGGAIALCLALPFAPYVFRLGSLALAQQRWERNGGPNYTIVVSQGCFCPDPGRYRLTVRQGQVIAVEAYTPLGGAIPANPANFQGLTVEAAFRNARRALATNWKAPWFSTLYVKYEPTYGYVSRIEVDANGLISGLFYTVYDSHYSYSASNLQLQER